MFSYLYQYFFGYKPKYILLEYKNDFFPVRKNNNSYNQVLEKKFDGLLYWKVDKHIESIILDYPNLHAEPSLNSAKKLIERKDNVTLKRTSSKYHSFSKGEIHFFDEKEKVNEKDEKKMESMSLDELIDKKFTKEEILNTKVGAERTSKKLKSY